MLRLNQPGRPHSGRGVVAAAVATGLLAAGLALAPVAAADDDTPTPGQTPPLDAGRTSFVPPQNGPTSADWTYAVSQSVTFPRDLRTPAPAPSCPALPRDWLTRERAKGGTDPWPYPLTMENDNPVDVYPEQASVPCGAYLNVHVGGSGTTVLKVFRVGDYRDGAPGRLVWQSSTVRIRPAYVQPRRSRNIGDFRWPTVVRVPVTSAFVPGLYLITANVNGHPSGLNAFVVRHRERQPVVVQHSDATWAAYNGSGGASFYSGTSFPGEPPLTPDGGKPGYQRRAYTVTVHRNLEGSGRLALLTFDVPNARLTDRLGVAADHVLDSDVDAAPSLLRGRRLVMLPGHPEYQSNRSYAALLAARNTGTNVAVLGANDVYWRTTFNRDSSGALVSFTCSKTYPPDPKLILGDPEQATAPLLREVPQLDSSQAGDGVDATVLFVGPPTNRDQAALLGQAFGYAGVVGDLRIESGAPSWLLAGTGVRAGFWLADALGNEANSALPSSPAAAPNLTVVASTYLRRPGTSQYAGATTTLYTDARSGAAVFDAGTTTWSCAAVGGPCLFDLNPSRQASDVMFRITQNVVRVFTATTRVPATVRNVPEPATVAAQTPADRVGDWGASTADIEQWSRARHGGED